MTIEREPAPTPEQQIKALSARVAHLETLLTDDRKPTVYQYRMRATWFSPDDTCGGWSDWTECKPESAANYRKTPLLHDWLYEVRELYELNPLQTPSQTGE